MIYFYNFFISARKTFELELALIKSEIDFQNKSLSSPYESILAMFTRRRQLHVLRAVEPHLHIRYHQRKCHTYQCHQSLLLSQGTRSQLAQFALERELSA